MPLLRFAITSETVFGGGDEVSARVKVVIEGGVSGGYRFLKREALPATKLR